MVIANYPDANQIYISASTEHFRTVMQMVGIHLRFVKLTKCNNIFEVMSLMFRYFFAESVVVIFLMIHSNERPKGKDLHDAAKTRWC
jgi:hypothetical protein